MVNSSDRDVLIIHMDSVTGGVAQLCLRLNRRMKVYTMALGVNAPDDDNDTFRAFESLRETVTKVVYVVTPAFIEHLLFRQFVQYSFDTNRVLFVCIGDVNLPKDYRPYLPYIRMDGDFGRDFVGQNTLVSAIGG